MSKLISSNTRAIGKWSSYSIIIHIDTELHTAGLFKVYMYSCSYIIRIFICMVYAGPDSNLVGLNPACMVAHLESKYTTLYL